MPLPSPAVETAGYPYQTPSGVSSRLGVVKSVMSVLRRSVRPTSNQPRTTPWVYGVKGKTRDTFNGWKAGDNGKRDAVGIG